MQFKLSLSRQPRSPLRSWTIKTVTWPFRCLQASSEFIVTRLTSLPPSRLGKCSHVSAFYYYCSTESSHLKMLSAKTFSDLFPLNLSSPLDSGKGKVFVFKEFYEQSCNYSRFASLSLPSSCRSVFTQQNIRCLVHLTVFKVWADSRRTKATMFLNYCVLPRLAPFRAAVRALLKFQL